MTTFSKLITERDEEKQSEILGIDNVDSSLVNDSLEVSTEIPRNQDEEQLTGLDKRLLTCCEKSYRKRYAQKAESLFNENPDIKFNLHRYEISYLLMIAEKCHPDVLGNLLVTLINRGADVNSKDERGRTAAYILCTSRIVNENLNHPMKCLLDCSPNVEDPSFLLFLAARGGCWKTTLLLLSYATENVITMDDLNAAKYLKDLADQRSFPVCSCCRHDPLSMENYNKIAISLSKKTSRNFISLSENYERKTVFWRYFAGLGLAVERETKWNDVFLQWENQSGSDLIQSLNSYLDIYTDPEVLDEDNEWNKVRLAVESYVAFLIKELALENESFRGKILWVGSSFDGTKILLPNEFDCLFVLNSPNAITSRKPEYGERLHPLLGLFERLKNIVRNRYYPNIYEPHLVDYIRTGFKLEFCLGRKNKEPLRVTIDITPCVETTRQPENLPNWCHLATDEETSIYRIWKGSFMNPDVEEEDSYAELERRTLLNAGRVARRCMQLLRLLSLLVQSTELQIVDVIKMSYALKQYLFQHLNQEPPPWKSQDIRRHCIRIVELLGKVIKHEYIKRLNENFLRNNYNENFRYLDELEDVVADGLVYFFDRDEILQCDYRDRILKALETILKKLECRESSSFSDTFGFLTSGKY